MPNVGPQELILILIIALLVFGPKKLPEIGRAVGQGLREFKKISNDLTASFHSMANEVEEPIKEVKSQVDDSTYNESEVDDSIYNESEVEEPVYKEEANKEGDIDVSANRHA